MNPRDMEARKEVGLAVAQQYLAEDWTAIRQRFNHEMAEGLSEQQLREGWAWLRSAYGRAKISGAPTSSVMGENTIVDVPLRFRRGLLRTTHRVRVSFSPNGEVAGLFVLRG